MLTGAEVVKPLGDVNLKVSVSALALSNEYMIVAPKVEVPESPPSQAPSVIGATLAINQFRILFARPTLCRTLLSRPPISGQQSDRSRLSA